MRSRVQEENATSQNHGQARVFEGGCDKNGESNLVGRKVPGVGAPDSEMARTPSLKQFSTR